TRVHSHLAHAREVDDQTSITRREPGEAVAAGPNRGMDATLTRICEARLHILHAAALRDGVRAAIDGPIPRAPGRVVAGVGRSDEAVSERCCKVCPRAVADAAHHQVLSSLISDGASVDQTERRHL